MKTRIYIPTTLVLAIGMALSASTYAAGAGAAGSAGTDGDGTHDPLLRVRLAGEVKQEQPIANGLSNKTFVLSWLANPPVGVDALSKLVTRPV